MKQEPRLFIDMSFEQGNQIVMYGVSDLFKIGKNVKPQVSTVGSNFISNNNNTTEVSYGNNRSEGGNKTINKRNTRKSPNVNEGTGESIGNRGNNRNRALAGMLDRVAPKPTPIQIRNSNSNSNNNMNNANRALAGMLGQMGPSQGQKRKRENNAQSGVGSRNSMAGNKKNNLKNNAGSGNSQPNNRAKKPKINVNVAQRNRLLKNLKNKGLSKNVINRFIKNYNNGTKGVNQILQEVKANAKRQQNAKNAAALRQLKQLRPELF